MSLSVIAPSLARLRSTRTRSISPENFDGSVAGGARAVDGTAAIAARDLGQGWKISPSIVLKAGEQFDIAEIEGSGVITHMWMTTHFTNWRTLIFRAHWDGANEPAVEVPLGDFFCNGWATFAQVSSAMIASNPNGGFNSYWPMPFQSSARLSIENTSDQDIVLYYQITYDIGGDHSEDGYFHAQWQRSNVLKYGETHTALENIYGRGHFVGMYVAWGSNSAGWWGEGEVKFYFDSEEDFPTICTTGTEDYFGGAWNFEIPGEGYANYSTPYLGMPQVLKPDGLYYSQQRFGMYRWHILDPIAFHEILKKVEIQALGWRKGWRYLPLQDDIASTCYFYLDSPIANRPDSPDVDTMEVHIGSEPMPDLTQNHGFRPPLQ